MIYMVMMVEVVRAIAAAVVVGVVVEAQFHF